jgi:hypothetical protein
MGIITTSAPSIPRSKPPQYTTEPLGSTMVIVQCATTAARRRPTLRCKYRLKQLQHHHHQQQQQQEVQEQQQEEQHQQRRVVQVAVG